MALHLFRGIFLLFMLWMLVVFLPGHTRGRITMGPKSSGGDSCCAPTPPPVADDCCAPTPSKKSDGAPSAKDRANCAVCFWAAGLLADMAVSFDHAFAERAYAIARDYDAQVRREAIQLTHHGRDPPAAIG